MRPITTVEQLDRKLYDQFASQMMKQPRYVSRNEINIEWHKQRANLLAAFIAASETINKEEIK